MTVTEIHFNHDRASASTDAINLRENGEPNSEIEAPEWANGESKPVAYATAAITGPVTIQVKFKGGPPGGSLNIRAVRPGGGPIRGPMRTRAPLGDVKKRLVRFNSAGHSALETFELARDLTAAPVGSFQTNWEWQANHGGQWQTFGTTHHRTYVLPALPTDPWNQRVGANIAWPWVTALDKACFWAFGAATVDDAAAAIAAALNAHPMHLYDEDGEQFVSEGHQFLLTNYLSELKGPDEFIIDCRGIATAMVTFANLLGAALMPLQIENGDSSFFSTKDIKPLNAGFTTETWGRHEIAVVPQAAFVPDTALPAGAGANLLIYDAGLHVDIAAPVLPVRMLLGSVAGGSDYRFKLINSAIDGDDGDKVTPLAIRPVI